MEGKIMNINTNYHSLTGKDIAEEGGYQYRVYRRKWHDNPQDFVVEEFPLFLDIEATSACNLKCPHCIQTRAGFKKGYMDFELYKRIIDEAADNGCYGVKYHTIGRGEPLLHKKLSEMIEYAKKKGLIDVYLNTNAVLLTDELGKKLLDVGLDRISFSIDGYEEKEYEKNRPGAKFSTVMRNVIWFYLNKIGGKYKTKVRIQTVALPGLDLNAYKNFWGYHADEVAAISFKNMGSRVYGLKSNWACPQLWQRMSILYNGTTLPCNHDDRLLAKIIYFPKQSIKEAWNSWYVNKMRRLHKEGRGHEISACNGCFLRTAEILKGEK